MMILTTVLATITTVSIATAAISLVSHKSFDKYCEKEDGLKKVAEDRLNLSLKSLCSQLNIPLSYSEEMGEVAGRLLYHSKQGRLILDRVSIEIAKSNENRPYVLAYELGAYMDIRQRDDISERGAYIEAYKLCCSILTDREKRLLSVPLRCYFHLTLEQFNVLGAT